MVQDGRGYIERGGLTSEGDDRAQATELLQLHATLAHSMAHKPEKLRRLTLNMPGDAVEDNNWDRFIFQFEHYKKLAGVDSDSSRHLLECFSNEDHEVLFSTYGKEITGMTEADLSSKLKRLIVRQCNAMTSAMKVLKMHQDSDQLILSYIAQIKVAARQFSFKVKCT